MARIGLGFFEAGFAPVIPFYLCACFSPILSTIQNLTALHTYIHTAIWYTKDELGLRVAHWFGFAAVSGAFGGLVAFGIQNVHASVADWRLLFIIEVRNRF